jgi:WD40 repeat protein
MAEALTNDKQSQKFKVKKFGSECFGQKYLTAMAWNPRDDSLTLLNNRYQVFVVDSEANNPKLLFDCQAALDPCLSGNDLSDSRNMSWNKSGTFLALRVFRCVFVWNSVEQCLKVMGSCRGNRLEWIRDGSLFATFGHTEITVWNPTKNEVEQKIDTLLNQCPTNIDWLSQNNLALACGKCIYFLQVGSTARIKNSCEHKGDITAIEFESSGEFLTAGSKDGMVKIWRTNNPESVPGWKANYQTEKEGIKAVRCLYNTNLGPRVIVSFSHSKINIWNFDGICLRTHQIKGEIHFISPTGQFYVCNEIQIRCTLNNQFRGDIPKRSTNGRNRTPYSYIFWSSQENTIAFRHFCSSSEGVVVVTLKAKKQKTSVEHEAKEGTYISTGKFSLL